MVPAAPIIVEEHEVVHETVVTGPSGLQAAEVDIEDDVIIHGAGGAIAGTAAGCSAGGLPCEPGRAGALPPPPGHPHNC